jgi:hypothetical protein
MINRRVSKFLAAIAALMVLSTIAYAFAAAIVVPDTNAGIGNGDILGYTVSAIDYTLNADPTNLDSVDITLSTAADEVQVRANGGSWVACTGGPTTWSCTLGITVASAASLEVVAYTNIP